MKKLIVFMVIFALFIIGFMIYTISTYITLNGSKRAEEAFAYKYHFVVIAQQKNNPYWKEVQEGANSAAAKLNVAIQFVGPEQTDFQQELNLFEMAVASKVDGIITHAFDDKRFISNINRASDSGIPVITIDNDSPQSKRICYVGTNNYEVGLQAARELISGMVDIQKIAIITGNYQDSQQNMRVLGFIDEITEKTSCEIVTTLVSDMSVMEAMSKAQTVLYNYPDVDLFYCTDSIDTVGIAKVIVDANKVGVIKIIGFGDQPDTLRFVDKGVIYATMVQKPYMMGKLAVQNLYNYKNGEQISEFVNTSVEVVK